MEKVKCFISDNGVLIGAGIAVTALSAYIYKTFRTKEHILRECGKDYPRDTVIVHQSLRSEKIPSLGHFVMKLETYLRITKIPFQPYFEQNLVMNGPKNKIPWIEYNGQEIGDSQLIINFLNKEMNVDLNKHMTSTQRALAWAVQKWVEEFTYWLNVYTKWCLCNGEMFSGGFIRANCCEQKAFENLFGKMTYITGIGRHTPEEVAEFMKNDLRHLSAILGDQQYLFGSRPTEVDCAVFGILSEIRWATPDSCPGKQLLKSELKNLVAYLDRIKKNYWPDWEDRLLTS